MSDHILWNEIDKGFADETMKRTIKVVEWLSQGFEIQLGSRHLAMVERVNGGPYLAMKASCSQGDKELPPVALGMEPDLGLLYSMVKPLNEQEWLMLAANVALTEVNRVKRGKLY